MDPLLIALAFVTGFIFRKLGYPPLLGYLCAGFVAHGFGYGSTEAIQPVADLGIILLLFTIGLKLNPKELLEKQVWGVACLQMLLVIPLTFLMIQTAVWLIPGLDLPSNKAAWVLAFALSFSSTVFAAKIFDERGESAAIHAAIAIGILIVQDLFAVGYLVVSSGKLPSVYALGLLALPLLRPILGRILVWVGHGELLVLFGIVLALGASQLFYAVQLKGDLGALVAGILLSQHFKSNELYKNLIQFKDLFLIGFFLQIGYNGLPDGSMIGLAVLLALLIFLRPLIYTSLFMLFHLRARTALLAAIALCSYSEFGLIVAAMAASSGILPASWVTAIALALALSFFIATPFNTRTVTLQKRVGPWLQRLERTPPTPEDAIQTLGDERILIVGSGRVGVGAYRFLEQTYPGQVACVEEIPEKVVSHQQAGINCIHGDGADIDFWEAAQLDKRHLILVSLTNHHENIEVIKLLQNLNYGGKLAVISRYPDEEAQIRNLGCISFNLYAEAGHGFAEHVISQVPLDPDRA